MPYPFALPTTSSFSFSSSFACDSHPSLPITTSTYRGVAKDALKKHKRLSPSAQMGNMPTVTSSLNTYMPYLYAVAAGLHDQHLPTGSRISVTPRSPMAIKWRPTLSGDFVPGRDRARVRATSIDHEISFVMSALAFAHVLSARASLQPLYSTSGEYKGAAERTTAITTATKSLLESAAIFTHLAERSERILENPPSVDIAPTTIRALAALSYAEATLLAVLKDDPYPAVVAQDRNKNDTEWMFKSPEIPKVRAHLFARLCLEAAEHAARAASLAQPNGQGPTNKIDTRLTRYIEDFRRTSKAKACRFLGIDAELGGETADGIAWLRAGLSELGVDVKDNKKGLSLSRFKKELSEKMEDRRVDKETAWGADAGKLEEIRVIEMLDEKWNKINDTMNTKLIPSINTLVAKMPSGREIYTIPKYSPPGLDRGVLESMRAMPEGDDDFGNDMSSDDEMKSPSVHIAGSFPSDDLGRSSTAASSRTYF